MPDERRGDARFKLWFPMQVRPAGAEPVLAVSQNISRSGILIATAAALEAGAAVDVIYRIPEGEERHTGGTIVRVEPNTEDPDGLWPYYVAVEFDSPVADVEALVERTSTLD